MSEVARKERIRSLIDREGMGLEIGPSFNPTAPKSEGYRVHTVDHMDRAGLMEKYQGHNVNVAAIEEVDYIWAGGSLADLIGAKTHYDWIIASHVVEHLPDLIGFIKDCQKLLRPGGILALAIPDKRFCFDYLRWPSSTGDLIQAHLDSRKMHTPGQIFDAFSKIAKLGEAISWERGRVGEIAFLHADEFGPQMLKTYLDEREYTDIHAWVFTPSSFRLIFHELNEAGLLSINEKAFVDTIGCEFLIAFSNEASTNNFSRLGLAKMAIDEMRSVFFP
ncbi:MAG TPA: methyltransferase domain-containing protein [Rhodanobacter sp.]|nr:methyltransferase domain-containing protein [Rhodanobacter sp.]